MSVNNPKSKFNRNIYVVNSQLSLNALLVDVLSLNTCALNIGNKKNPQKKKLIWTKIIKKNPSKI